MEIHGKLDNLSSSGAELTAEELLLEQKNKEMQQEIQASKTATQEVKKEVTQARSSETLSTPEREAFANLQIDFADTMTLWNKDQKNNVLRDQAVTIIQQAGKAMQSITNAEGASAPDGSPLDVIVQRRDMKEKYELMMEQIGFKNITVNNAAGDAVPITSVDNLDSHYEKLIPKETRETIKRSVLGDIGTMARPSTMDEITALRGVHGNAYALEYAKLQFNRFTVDKRESKAEFFEEAAKIFKDNDNKVFGKDRNYKKALKHITKLNKSTEKKLERADKLMIAWIKYAGSKYHLSRATNVTDYMINLSAPGSNQTHGMPSYGANDIWSSQEGHDIIQFAQVTYGDQWKEKIATLITDKKLQAKLLPPYASMSVLIPTKGVESSISGGAGMDDETLATFGDGRVDMMPGSPEEALSWYLHKYNTVNLEGNNKVGVIDTARSLYIIERWISNKGGSYDLIGALVKTKNPKTGVLYTETEAREIGQQVLKDALTSKPNWRGQVRTRYSYYADNYRVAKAKREGKPGKYAGRTKADIPEEDMWKLWSMATVDATASVFCGKAHKDLVRDRFSKLYENGTAAWHQQHGYVDGLSNPIVGKNIHRIMNEIDGAGTGGIKDRYIGSVYRNGHFAGLPQAAENTFNLFAKDVLGMDGDAAHKIGKIGKYATVAGLFVAGWKLAKRVWRGDGTSTSFMSKVARLGVVGGAAMLFGSDMKAIISGGSLGKKGLSKWIAGLFGMETDVEGSEGFTPVQTLSYVFGDLSTKQTLEMFSYNSKEGIFMLDENAVEKIKKVHPGLTPNQLKTIESMLNEPESQLNEHLNLGLKTVGVTDATSYAKVMKDSGGVKFGEYINTFTLQSQIAGQLTDIGLDLPEAQQDELTTAIQTATPAERLVMTERLKQVEAYGKYYEAMSVKMTHILTYRTDMVTNAGLTSHEAAIKAGLADTAGYQKNTMDFILSRDGFDATSDLQTFEDTLADTMFAGDELMKGSAGIPATATDPAIPATPGILDRLKGYDYMNEMCNVPGVDAIMDDYAASKDWYVNRVTGETYAEKLLKIGDYEVFVSVEQGSDDIAGAPAGTKKSALSFWVPQTTGGRKEWKIQQYAGEELNVKGIGWEDIGSGPEFVLDQYGGVPQSGTTSTTYEDNVGMNVRMMETIVENAMANKGTFDLGTQDLGSLANTAAGGVIPIKMEATGNTKP